MDSVLHRRMLGLVLLTCASVSNLLAGGSGLNLVVIVNQGSSNSCELGNYVCERRHVPPENVLRINWPGGNISWTSNDFYSVLLTPLLDMLAERQLTNQVDCVVLSMDIPFQTSSGSSFNATTAALFYGLKLDGGADPGVTNSYAASEAPFGNSKPASAPGASFLTTMITAETLAQAKALVDRGLASDGTYPSQSVILAKSSDLARNIRHPFFDNAIFNVRLRGVSTILRTNTDGLGGQTGLLGYQTGLAQYDLPPDIFIPGAFGDSLTSSGGVIFGPNPQTNLLAFIKAGATGSYGTVSEPTTDAQKFPDPQVYFYQARGFTLVESVYQSIPVPYLGLSVGEPLASPFARAGAGDWNSGISNSILSGSPHLAVQFSAPAGNPPLQQIDLFIDGRYFGLLTNLPPCPGNTLTVTLNGYPITYVVPTNSTISTVSAGLAAMINAPAVTNATRVKAFVHGDRVELQSMATNPFAVPFFVPDTTCMGLSDCLYRVAYLPDSYPPHIVPVGTDQNGVFRMDVEMPTALPAIIQATTNLLDWVPIFTNAAAGLLAFSDFDSTNFPSRFYRILGSAPDQAPTLSMKGIDGYGMFQLDLESQIGQACAIQVSSNLADWASVFTNEAGGAAVFTDPEPAILDARYYRAWLAPLAPPGLTVVTGTTAFPLVRIDNAARPYTVEVSDGGGPWIGLNTNFAIGEIRVTTANEIGTGETLSTFLTASRSRFLATEAFGRQGYSVSYNGSPAMGAYIELTFVKTSGQSVVVGVTNNSGGVTSTDLAGQLVALVNSNSLLQEIGGVVAEDFVVDLAGNARFNLVARSPGLQAAALRVVPRRSGLALLPSSSRTLTQNLSDLQPRNHLYITAGAGSLPLSFPLETTALADGYHELTAVAYEGSHVRAQTRATVPVRVQNTDLSATISLLDLPDTAPAQGAYHIQVVASTNNVSTITLFSTGGALAVATNESAATFEVYGTNLCAGLHPFYALVETSSGLKYRTETRWVRLLNEP